MLSCALPVSKSTVDKSEEIKNGFILDSNNLWRLYSSEFLLLQESVLEYDSFGRITPAANNKTNVCFLTHFHSSCDNAVGVHWLKPTWQVVKHDETRACLSPQVPTYVLSRYVNIPHKDIKNQIEIPPREQQLKIAFYRPFYSRASIISLLLRNHQIMSSFF